MADAMRKLYEGWLALRWPIGTPSKGPDWSDVETAFRAGYHEGCASGVADTGHQTFSRQVLPNSGEAE